MILVKCFIRSLVQEAMGVHTLGNLPVKWVAGERINELLTRPAWSNLESFLGYIHRRKRTQVSGKVGGACK